MTCVFCKEGTLRSSVMPELVQNEENFIIIKNIPCFECDNCGEKYYTESVRKQLEEIIAETKKKMEEVVAVIDYTAAA